MKLRALNTFEFVLKPAPLDADGKPIGRPEMGMVTGGFSFEVTVAEFAERGLQAQIEIGNLARIVDYVPPAPDATQ